MLNDTKVKTNDKYFERYGRTVYGTIENEIDPNNKFVIVVRVQRQEGNIIPEHQDQRLVMLVDDLEIIK